MNRPKSPNGHKQNDTDRSLRLRRRLLFFMIALIGVVIYLSLKRIPIWRLSNPLEQSSEQQYSLQTPPSPQVVWIDGTRYAMVSRIEDEVEEDAEDGEGAAEQDVRKVSLQKATLHVEGLTLQLSEGDQLRVTLPVLYNVYRWYLDPNNPGILSFTQERYPMTGGQADISEQPSFAEGRTRDVQTFTFLVGARSQGGELVFTWEHNPFWSDQTRPENLTIDRVLTLRIPWVRK